MSKEILTTILEAAEKKHNKLKNSFEAYYMSAVMAGIFIGLGGIFMGVVAGHLTAVNSPYTKLISGLVFSVGLCCVTVLGAELFTGNNFTMTVGSLTGKVAWADTLKTWAICYLGNFVGSLIIALLFCLTEIPKTGAVNEFFLNAGIAKTTADFGVLFAKGILCNILVCLAIWSNFSLKSQAAKLFMNVACVTTFVACGFEHSVANMSLLTITLVTQTAAEVTFGGVIYNLFAVTLGNMLGGILFVAVPCVVLNNWNSSKI